MSSRERKGKALTTNEFLGSPTSTPLKRKKQGKKVASSSSNNNVSIGELSYMRGIEFKVARKRFLALALLDVGLE